MYPSSVGTLSNQQNLVFFASNAPSLAISAISVIRSLLIVFNSSDTTLYLGNEDVSAISHLAEVPPGKVAVLEDLPNGDLYCANSSSGMTMIQGSQYF